MWQESPKLLTALKVSTLLAFWYVIRLAYNVYFHPLRNFPGPKLASATRWYEGYYDMLVGEGGQYMQEIDRMHAQYGLSNHYTRLIHLSLRFPAGPIVRIAPNELHIKDTSYISTLYSLGSKRHKVPYIVDIFGTPKSSTSRLLIIKI